MNKELDNLVFSTKSIMITDKQKHLIEDLLDQLNDWGEDQYNDIKYWNLSKKMAIELIGILLDRLEFIENYNPCDDYIDSMDYGDR